MSETAAETTGPTVRLLVLGAIPALVIGVGAAVVLWLLDLASDALEGVIWEWLPATLGIDGAAPGWIFGVLTGVGLLVGLIVWLVPGHGGPDSATSELIDKPVGPGVLPTLAAVTVLGLAGGVSLGPENPIMVINAALVIALFAKGLKLMEPQPAMLLSAAATIGALFGTPVAAALILTGIVSTIRGGGSLWDRLFLPVAAAGAGAVTMRLLGGSAIAFTLPSGGPPQPIDLLTGAVIACVGAVLAILAAVLLPWAHAVFHSLGNPVIFTTLGGAVLGLLGVIGGPITLFKGLDQTGELLTHPDDYDAGQLALIVVVKLIALVVAAAAGFRGGRIFPAVFIGVAFGLLAHALVPAVPLVVAVAAGVLGLVLAASRDGWIAMFLAVALTGDIALLPLLCVIVLPAWLVVTRAPELMVKVPRTIRWRRHPEPAP